MFVRFLFGVVAVIAFARTVGAQHLDGAVAETFSTAPAPEAMLVGPPIRAAGGEFQLGVHRAMGERFLNIYWEIDGPSLAANSLNFGPLQNPIGIYVVDVNQDGQEEILLEERWEDGSVWSIFVVSDQAAGRHLVRGELVTEIEERGEGSRWRVRPGESTVSAFLFGDQLVSGHAEGEHRPCWYWQTASSALEANIDYSGCDGSAVEPERLEKLLSFVID